MFPTGYVFTQGGNFKYFLKCVGRKIISLRVKNIALILVQCNIFFNAITITDIIKNNNNNDYFLY